MLPFARYAPAGPRDLSANLDGYLYNGKLSPMATQRSKSLPIVHQPAAQLYRRFVEGIKEHIRAVQIKGALAANAELVLHYWEIGREILANQKRQGWGAKVIDQLADDLWGEFPKLAGYSSRNLKYMRAFAAAWPDRRIMQQLAAQIPWKDSAWLLGSRVVKRCDNLLHQI